MTRNAGNTLVIKRPLHMRILSQCTGKQSRRVVTRFAMPGVLNSLLRLNIFDVLLIERFAKGVPVCGLSPLGMGIGVTIATTFRGNKHFTGNKSTGAAGRIAGREGIATKFEIVILRDLLGIVRRWFRLGPAAKERKCAVRQ